jgi:hypothetical protein
MNTVMLDEPKDLILVHAVSQRPSIPLNRLTGCSQMRISAFFFNQLGTNEKPVIVVLSQDHILETFQGRAPTMLGGVMLEQIPRPRRFKPDKDLFLFFQPGMIITMSKSKIPECFSAEGIAEGFLSFLG